MLKDDYIDREPCEDCISRQAAIDAIYHHLPSVSRMEVRLMLHEVPSAQPEPEEDCDTCKHGYFGDSQCNNCRMRFPIHYEREEEQHEET